MRKIILVILVCSSLCSCVKNRIGRDSLVTTSDGYGNIESKIRYINDSIKHGEAEYFYKNGKLKDRIMYKNNVKDGQHLHYFSNGQIQSKMFFKKGIQEGKTYWYYPNGKLEQESNWRNGKTFGNALYYYPTGNFQAYRCFDFQGNIRYVAEFDTLGNTLVDEGIIVGQLFLKQNYDSIKINQKIEAEISVASPPNKEVKVMVYEYNDTGNLLSKYEGAVKDNLMEFHTSYKSIGRYKVVVKGEMRSGDSNVIKSDSIIALFNVVGN